MSNKQTNKMSITSLTLLSLILWPKAYAQTNKSPVSQKLKMDIGYFAEVTKMRLIDGIPSMQEAFAKRGLPVEISVTKAGTSTPKTPVTWDLAISNFVLVSMQRKNKIAITPIFLAKDCQFEVAAFATNPNAMMDNLKNKKVLVYGFGYPTSSILRAIKEWGLSDASIEITNIPGQAQNALLQKKFDLLVTDTVVNSTDKTHIPTVFGPTHDKEKFKQVALTDYKYPCRSISVANKVSPKNVELIKKVVADGAHPNLKRFDLINSKEAAKLEATLNDPSFAKIAAKMTEYKEK